MAISALSVQSNLFIGALVNSTFASIIEIILFIIAIREGLVDMVKQVEAAMFPRHL